MKVMVMLGSSMMKVETRTCQEESTRLDHSAHAIDVVGQQEMQQRNLLHAVAFDLVHRSAGSNAREWCARL